MVLLMDMSNLVYTGMSSKERDFGEQNEITLRAVPYVLNKIAAFYSVDKDIVAVFDSPKRKATVANTRGYKAGRQYNPAVSWELNILKELLSMCSIPTVSVAGQEADYVINNLCAKFRGEYDVYIASADADMFSNVYSEDGVCCEMVSFSQHSYHVNKRNFEATTGVPYNFINLDKILNGCKSDNIKPFPKGSTLFQSYINYLQRRFARMYKFDKNLHTFSMMKDSVIFSVNTLDAFLEFFRLDEELYSPEAEKELRQRELLIQGPKFPVLLEGEVDWESFNRLAKALGLEGCAEILTENVLPFDYDYYKRVIGIIKQITPNTPTMFEESTMATEVNDVSLDAIFGILDEEGDL